MNSFVACRLAVAAAPLVAAAPIDGLAWMSGCRVAERDEAGSDEMWIGRIEGRHDGRERRVDYPMRRVACPGGVR
jgi:hypothetical protein